jgi:GPH family glycoside/pentoside/hexuronide:cation symporter
MATAILCFIGAYGLGKGDILAFAGICILSGMTLGADSMLLPSLLGDALADKPGATATGFGLWNLINKLTMAFAAGIVLPLLAAAGYHSAAPNNAHALQALSFCYALLPCAFKTVAILLLHISPLDQRRTACRLLPANESGL